MKTPALLPSVAILFLCGCNRALPCPDCDDGDPTEAELDDGDLPDLPCGGADLMNDDLNCGSCGNECVIQWPGTDYSAGHCDTGECGPYWTGAFTHVPPPVERICTEMCALDDRECVANGCSGLTAYVCVVEGDFGDECNLSTHEAIKVTGGCDEPVPYPINLEPYEYPNFACCCQ